MEFQNKTTLGKTGNILVVALAGGVGGARLADGLARMLPLNNLTVIVNVGDDFEHLGLTICPDLDTVCYTLAGLANPVTGWGIKSDSRRALDAAIRLGGPDWFGVGDCDLGTHLERTRRLRQGETLSQVTRVFCAAWGVRPRVLPATDDPSPTIVHTVEGKLAFQEYFVRRRCEPQVTGFEFPRAAEAKAAPGVLAAIEAADFIVYCPSNPWVSIDPVLAIPEIRMALAERRKLGAPIAAVSPIIGGKTLKGPAAKMYAELGIAPSALAVARHYQGLASHFILDKVDAEFISEVEALGMRALATDAVMHGEAGRARLAEEVIVFGLGEVN